MSSRNRAKQNGVTIDEAHLEALNESMAESLSSKIGQLKSLAIDLDTETHDHLPLLDGLDDGFESGIGRLSGTFNRLRLMGRGHWTNGRKFVMIIAALTMAMLFFIYIFSQYR